MSHELLQLTDSINIKDIARNPNNYPEEVVAVGLDAVKKLKSELYELHTRLEGNIIERMTLDDATKLTIRDIDGADKTVTLKSGSVN